MLLPSFRLGHFHTNVKGERGRQRADPEHGTPTPNGQEKASGEGGQKIADGITGLQNAAQNAAPAHGSGLHGQRGTHAPFAAHANAVKGAHDEEKREVRRKAAEEFDHGKINDVSHQRNAAAVAVGKQTEDERADGTHGERRGQRADDFRFGDAELRGEAVHEEDHHEEIEGVERPAQESSEDSVAGAG